MIFLFDSWDTATEDLRSSLVKSGSRVYLVGCKDDGWFPRGVRSPYKNLTGYKGRVNRGLYFNELPIPDGFSIENKGIYAEVTNLGHVVGRAYYHGDVSKRQIGWVDWLTPTGEVLVKDYYCIDGFRFRTDTFVNGKVSTSSWMTASGDVVLHRSYASNLFIRQMKGVTHVFNGEVEMFADFLTNFKFDTRRFLINSLALPFSIMRAVNPKGANVLYWQENPQEVPANLLAFVNMSKKNKVYFRCAEQAELLRKSGVSARFLPPVLEVGDKDLSSVSCFTLTNTDDVVNLEHLVSSQPQVTFHVGALTNMSNKLLNLGAKYSNLVLHPNLSQGKVAELVDSTNVYLDINRGAEVSSVVRSAVLSGSLLMGYRETMHQPVFSVGSMFFDASRDALAVVLGNISGSESQFRSVLDAYHTMLGFSDSGLFSKICQ